MKNGFAHQVLDQRLPADVNDEGDSWPAPSDVVKFCRVNADIGAVMAPAREFVDYVKIGCFIR